MAVSRSAALKLDWAKVATSLGLRGQTAASLQSFKKRNDDARRKVQVLSETPQSVDFEHYRSVLKNQAVINEIEAHFKAFQPATFDVNRQLKAIEAFEAQAVKGAEETKGAVALELRSLEKTLENIETARPFEDLSCDDVAAARPEVLQKTKEMVAKGKWMPPGYKENFGDLSFL
ncbi:ATP synthase subunit D, mitochondrial [Polytolypa hystricis UAMH7299]|uniref:ATP synthase subunit d, mitochondrial n=1 Tax=Polytolypa hystricis (strain UAMH7299) TaxID=1447883 RepID=A0A2B7XV03_POLH7|nr:ATP synthase subunit D, mitochondrial [Polytolypa hystricis UAMH7299]